MKKILFLDHDGVICLPKQYGSRYTPKADSDFDFFDSKAVKVLNEIIQATDCDIVVSSDWRYHTELSDMQTLYLKRKILKAPIAYTPNRFGMSDYYEKCRCTEITHWLEANNDVKSWVAVDDMDLSALGPNFIRCGRSNEGIKQVGLKDKIINILNA